MKIKNLFRKSTLINLSLFLASSLLLIGVMEVIFPRILNKIPLAMHPGLDPGVGVLAQTSKKSVVPRDYVALVGDSNAVGVGDWLKEVINKNRYRLTSPDYNTSHLIYRRTGMDVISLGGPGAGSLGGIVDRPISALNYLNSIWAFELEKPKMILVYFYEGNDLNDNLRDFNARYLGNYDPALLRDPSVFKEFIQKMVIEKSPLYNTDFPLKNLIFTRYLIKGMKNGWREIEKDIHQIKGSYNEFFGEGKDSPPAPEGSQPVAVPPQRYNIAMVAGKEVVLPNHLQGPAMELSEEEIKRTLCIFEQSLDYMADFFKESEIGVVYIPSPLSSYEMASPVLSVQSYLGRGDQFKSEAVTERSRMISREIEKIAVSRNLVFLDAGRSIRQAAREEVIHGPRNWKHLNKKGYHVLADAVMAAFFDSKKEPVSQDYPKN